MPAPPTTSAAAALKHAPPGVGGGGSGAMSLAVPASGAPTSSATGGAGATSSSSSAAASVSPPPSPFKTGSIAYFSGLLTTPLASIFGGGGASPAPSGGATGGGARSRVRAAIHFGLGPPPSPSPVSVTITQLDEARDTKDDSEVAPADDEELRPPPAVLASAGELPPEDSPARAVLSREQLQDLAAGAEDADAFTYAAPSPLSVNGASGPPRTPARPPSNLAPGSSSRSGGPRSTSANTSNPSSTNNPNSAYATLSRVKTRASAASLRASLRTVSGASSQAGGGSAFVPGTGAGSGAGANGTGVAASSAGGGSAILGRGSAFLGHSSGPGPAASWQEALERAQKLDAYVEKAVFQAGVDYESRPMVVLAACGIPDPKEVDHDALFDRIMATMELFVETDYTLIYFASGGKHAVRWSWIWKVYRRIGRKFRKNLKRVYIVHPTFFTKRFVDFISTGSYFVSPKFARKIVQVQTLSQLATHIPLTQIDIPPEVLRANQAHEKSVTLPPKARSASSDSDVDQEHQMFGVALEALMGQHGEKGGIPRVVRDCVEALRTPIPSATTGEPMYPLDSEGLFRRSPPSALLKTVQESYDRGHPVKLTLHYQDPSIPAALLKVFFRSLPTSIFPSSLYPTIRACPHPSSTSSDGQETIHYIRNVLLAALEPPSAVPLLSYVFELLHEVAARSATNRMDAANLATVFAPNLVSSGNIAKDMMMCRVEGLGQMATSMPTTFASQNGNGPAKGTTPSAEMSLGTVIKICIERYHEIFDQVDAEIRPVYGSELSAHLDALDLDERQRRLSIASSAGCGGVGGDSSLDHMDDAETNAARLQHQLRRTGIGAAGRLASVTESSAGESVPEGDEEDEDGDEASDGSPSRETRRMAGASSAHTAARSTARGHGTRQGRARPPALDSSLRNGNHAGGTHGLGLVNGHGDEYAGPSGSTPSASPLSPRVIKRLADADPADVSMLAFHDASSPGSHLAVSPSSASTSTATVPSGMPTPTSVSTSLVSNTTASPSPASASVSLPSPHPLSPSDRTTRSGKSITGIGGDGFRSPFGAASIGRNSSGSLRLTRDRLRSGSGSAFFNSGGAGGGGGQGEGAPALLSPPSATSSPAHDRSFLTSTASAVAVSGASVSGLFTSPSRSFSTSSALGEHEEGSGDGGAGVGQGVGEDESVLGPRTSPSKAPMTAVPHPSARLDDGGGGGEGSHDGSPASPTSPTTTIPSPSPRSPADRANLASPRKRAHRRGLSEVLEDLEQG